MKDRFIMQSSDSNTLFAIIYNCTGASSRHRARRDRALGCYPAAGITMSWSPGRLRDVRAALPVRRATRVNPMVALRAE